MARLTKVSELDADFIARATQVTSFNIRGADFESLKYKNEIQHLYATYMFKGFDLSKTIKGMDVTKVNNLINDLKTIDRQAFNNLYDFQPKGVGPGECLLYFLIDDATLGGGTSAGVDMKIGSKLFEVKGANLSGDKKSVTGFKLGGTVDLTDMVNKAVQMKEALGFTTMGKGKNEVNKTQIEAIQKNYPKEWKKIETEYANKAYKYFGNIPVIFFNNNRSGPKLTTAAGHVIKADPVKKTDIMIDVITQGTIKPKIKV